ncbi:MAG: endonuclease III [Deltaproteobacteria bacterium RIFCSPLOWO2_12_FULL_40_28]|nr:MAG: endonuclease III [Deltaproteobacteria bacterium RIFCSPHIGHO2_02_FULL_40_28]OGQ20156.1 MAG: endonuclease III [Deltaproteobacteria bacterium RIFCSPHIGHO2_12_FULL_40_32]OGQ40727.1 MAG: endonuclease III [Deltaproteobacteria bacterium RIFCSPLOWO2_02_FULL_40_36]OGQ54423.1 MAG: endonuclease III [Deltaproteobacteria bacterium RIFCSPLOWO2_12_FULL_40_28]
MMKPFQQKRLEQIITRLKKEYPQAKTALLHENPFQLLIATILSGQSTDKQVNKVTPGLFAVFKTPQNFISATQTGIEKLIFSTGYYKSKAKRIKDCCHVLMEKFGGRVPQSMEEMITLPGVGRKTANVVLGEAFGVREGICVDTHMMRLSQRLGFSKKKDAVKIEQDLLKIVPQKDWIVLPNLWIAHGRKVCFARKPNCKECVIKAYCPYFT